MVTGAVGHEPPRPGEARGVGGVRLVPVVVRSTHPEDETTELDRYGWEPLPEDTIESVLALYSAARAASDEAVDELGLDAVGRDEPEPDPVDMRWIMGHMIEETARHAGHADIIRELLDGTTGYYPPDPT